MKPSEKIEQIAFAMKRERPRWSGADAMSVATVRYLDEQHTLEQRRNAFRNALAMIGPGCPLSMLNEQLRKAEIDCEIVSGEPWSSAKRYIMIMAESAGLL